jgi:hypothetical protein
LLTSHTCLSNNARFFSKSNSSFKTILSIGEPNAASSLSCHFCLCRSFLLGDLLPSKMCSKKKGLNSNCYSDFQCYWCKKNIHSPSIKCLKFKQPFKLTLTTNVHSPSIKCWRSRQPAQSLLLKPVLTKENILLAV